MGDGTWPPIFLGPRSNRSSMDIQVSEVEEAYNNSLYSLARAPFCLLHWGLQNVETALLHFTSNRQSLRFFFRGWVLDESACGGRRLDGDMEGPSLVSCLWFIMRASCTMGSVDLNLLKGCCERTNAAWFKLVQPHTVFHSMACGLCTPAKEAPGFARRSCYLVMWTISVFIFRAISVCRKERSMTRQFRWRACIATIHAMWLLSTQRRS
jgi:hypothetical protein